MTDTLTNRVSTKLNPEENEIANHYLHILLFLLSISPVHDTSCSQCEQAYILGCRSSWTHQVAAFSYSDRMTAGAKPYLLK